MDENLSNIRNDDLRDALIIAGINELELYGLAGFSLRRVASACGVSCAAPYRHFKSKDDLILAIISYIEKRWSLLYDHICKAFEGDTHRSIMMLDDRSLDTLQMTERSKLTDGVHSLISRYCSEKAIPHDTEAKMSFAIFSILYGSVQMLGSGQIDNTPESMRMIKSCIEDAISSAFSA